MYIYYKIICCPSSQWSPAGALFAGCVFKLEDLKSPASAIAIGLGYTIANLTVIAGAGTVLRSEKVAGFHIGVAKCLKNATIRTGFLPYSIYEKVNFVNLQYSTCSGKTQLFISVAGLENLVILYGFFFWRVSYRWNCARLGDYFSQHLVFLNHVLN